MFNLRSRTTLAVVGFLAIVAFQAYGLYAVRNDLETRMGEIENNLQTVRSQGAAEITGVAKELTTVAEQTELAAKELEEARRMAASLKNEHAKTTRQLQNELASNSTAVTQLRQEAETKLANVHDEFAQAQDETSTKIGAVSGDVHIVKTDLASTKNDLAASRREIGDVRDSLGQQIARNSTELAELRRRGERDYFEFDIRKAKNMQRVGGLQMQLKATDTKRQKYDVVLLVDDSKLEKKGQLLNEPVQFLVGRDRLRYEIVVNAVDKDRIRGYVSIPKDKVLSAEGPAPR